jgi:hypothetical protein
MGRSHSGDWFRVRLIWLRGKYLLERALADFRRLRQESGEAFSLKDFFDRLNGIDSIPISLARWEMTGLDDDIRAIAGRR